MLKRALPYLLLALLTLGFFHRLAFTDMILARGDAFSYFYPYWEIRSEAFRAGHLPLWSPDIFMGVPLLADPQVGTFYLPNWLVTPLSAPDAVRVSILLHIFWAAAGTYLLFKHTVGTRYSASSFVHIPALIAAVVFALGGFIGAHVEQINQLQGLAWLPWLLWLLHRILSQSPHPDDNHIFSAWRVRHFLLFCAAWALQIFSGHTQTVFMTGVTLGVYALGWALTQPQSADHWRARLSASLQRVLIAVAVVAIGALGAVALALPQLLPTLELTGLSNRGGIGFNSAQATAFSLPPTYLGRALLPSYDGLLFGEYIGYVGVLAWGLALWGLLAGFIFRRSTDERRSAVRVWLAIVVIGLIFATGRYNGLYLALAEQPGFNLFRVPARWLALWALGVAMLAGLGGQHLLAQADAAPDSESHASIKRTPRSEFLQSPFIGIGLIFFVLIIFMALTRFVLPIIQEDITGSTVPTVTTLIGWGIGLLGFGLAFFAARRFNNGWAVVVLVVVECFAASFIMPYHDLAPRDVYSSQRFTVSQLQAYQQDQTPLGRIFSISNLYFDPGDKATLEARFRRAGMDENAIQIAFTAIKKQEVIASNLPLTWGIPSVDGYGGGILPTMYYTQFTSLLLTGDLLRTVDGRLGEALSRVECRGACIPNELFLQMMDTRYLLMDKIYDVWHEGIAYDTGFMRVATPQQPAAFHNETDFTATAIRVLYAGEEPPLVTFNANPLQTEFVTQIEALQLAHVTLPAATKFTVTDMLEFSAAGETTIHAVTLVDARTGDFDQLVPVGWQRVLSSDIKLYETDQSARALVVYNATSATDDWLGSETALNTLKQSTASYFPVIHGAETVPSHVHFAFDTAQIVEYGADMIRIKADSKFEDAYLLLADAWYPGWHATVNGEETRIYRANVMFRAIRVPKGSSEIVFTFQPDLWYRAIGAGAVVWLLWSIALLGTAHQLFQRR
jgi:hypothetical protein